VRWQGEVGAIAETPAKAGAATPLWLREERAETTATAMRNQPWLGHRFRPAPREAKVEDPGHRAGAPSPLRHDFALRGFVGLRSAGAIPKV